MNLKPTARFRWALCIAAMFALLAGFPLVSWSADAAVQVRLDAKQASPRAVEPLTERGILRDYRFAWTGLAQALEVSTLDPLEGAFAGQAKDWLRETIKEQQHSGLSQHYSGQNHHLEAVFYAPEGDVMELHDTAEYQLRVMDGGKVLHDDHIVIHYVVLMTPGADRWVIRQLQAVPHF